MLEMIQLNLLAVLVSALAAFFLGALWYSPILLGKAWVKAHGYTEEKMNEMRKTAKRAYLVSLFCYLIMAFVLATLLGHMQISSMGMGLWIGFLVWLGFAATIGLTSNMFSEKPLSTYLIDAGYQLAYLLIMSAILTAWR